MFRLENVTLRFGPRVIFQGLNWQVGTSDRIGLVGPNGAGKTSLLRVLAGSQEIDAGTVHLGRSTTIGYLPQDGITHKGRTVFEEARSVFAPLLNLMTRREDIQQEVDHLPHDSPRLLSLMEESERLEDTFRNAGGYQIESSIGSVLKGLGFEKSDWTRLTETYSGGWQMRLAMARLLLQRPSLLLLDEPTNHLDLEAREWLAEYLFSYPNAVVLVSHDRYFLDQVITRIADVEHGQVRDYFGNYTFFLKERENRRAAHRAAWLRQQQEIQHIETFIERFRYKATKASQVQSRVKMLEKLERLPPPVEESRGLAFRFPEPIRSGDLTLEMIDVTRRYGSLTVFDHLSLGLYRGEKVALSGPNGAGKSTLMRLLAGQEAPDCGMRVLGHQVFPAYFAQDQAVTLPPQSTLLDLITEVAPMATESVLRGLLGSFLFSGEDVFKRVEVLSGGERNRLALCLMLARPANLLLLDEPTNHLDLQAKEVLEEALRQFSGTVVFVSHDRAFLEGLATRVVEVGGGGIYNYPGTYREFMEHRKRTGQGILEEKRPADLPLSEPTGVAPASDQYREHKKAKRLLARTLERKELLPVEIEKKETELAQIQEQMEDPAIAHEYLRLLELEESRARIQAEVDSLYAEWHRLESGLEGFS